MALTLEWQHRIEAWLREMPRHLYHPVVEVPLVGHVTLEQYTVEEAAELPYEPMPAGSEWGAKWEYGWFKGQAVVPEAVEGERVVLQVDVGGESAIYVNGVATGAKDRQHEVITLMESGVPGTSFDIMIEAYAGHGGTAPWHWGPAAPGVETVPEPGPTQATVGKTTVGVWQEDVYQLWIDVQTLWQLRNNLDENSLRQSEIDAGLCDFSVIMDYELPREEMRKTARQARERLQPLLECVNGSTAPTMFCFGHSHIDVAWLWPLAETERKCVRTFGTQLALMEEYPEYRFVQSQPHLYWMVKNKYPRLYERIKAAIESGQWIPEGGMWVEADTNISGGESLIRQFLYGKRFFKNELGVDCKLLWLPDVFGYSGNMPQIMQGCGIDYFATAKIFWAYHGGAQFPYNTFTWEGIDGSEVLVHLCNNYNSEADPNAVIERWRERVQKPGISTRLFPFGWGDGGGGPPRDHLEYLRRQGDLEGVPRTVMAHPLDYFRDQERRGVTNRYVGELYFQAHRGTLTSQAKTKRGNRKSELALREAEMWNAAALALAGKEYPSERLWAGWRNVLLNQFHDIIPGSSIERVYQEAEPMYDESITAAREMARAAQAALADGGDAVTVFNSLSWERRDLVTLPEGWQGARDAAGQPVPVQEVGETTMAEVKLPSCGWTTLTRDDGAAAGSPQSGVAASETLLENDLLRISFTASGEISSIYDKEAQREWAAGPCNRLRMYKDVPSAWDAWDIDSMYPLMPLELSEDAEVRVLDSGPLVARIEILCPLHDSELRQVVSLRRGSRQVRFHTWIDWQETHKLLKVDFPVRVHANEALHEIQFGHLARPNHKSRPFDADRFEVANHKWTALTEGKRGFAVLNDCKYGVNVDGNSINLTLLKSAVAPDPHADRGLQEFTYAFYCWNTSLADSDLVREGYELNCPVTTVAGDGGTRSLFGIDAPNVVLDTVKAAEDGSGDLILRLYESKQTATRCRLSTTLEGVTGAVQTDMLEDEVGALDWQDDGVMLEFGPFKVLTVRLRMG